MATLISIQIHMYGIASENYQFSNKPLKNSFFNDTKNPLNYEIEFLFQRNFSARDVINQIK